MSYKSTRCRHVEVYILSRTAPPQKLRDDPGTDIGKIIEISGACLNTPVVNREKHTTYSFWTDTGRRDPRKEHLI